MHEQADDELTWNSTYVEDEHADKVVLKSGLGVVRSGKDKLKCQIEATLYYQPYPRIEFRCVCVENLANALDIMLNATQIKFVDAYLDVLVLSQVPDIDENGRYCVTYVQKTMAIVKGTDKTNVDELRLHIYNFEQFFSHRFHFLKQGSRRTRLDYVRLQYKEFDIEMRHVLKSTEQTQKMKNSVGFGITHHVKITHQTGKAFCPHDVLRHTKALGLTLSFLRGSLNVVPLISGLKNGELVYESWAVPLERWQYYQNIFDVWTHPDGGTNYIEELFPKFTQYIDSSNDDSWQEYEFLRRVVVTYNQANVSTYVPNSIILVQVAFETIAYQYLVERNKYMSKEGYTSLKYEADKFRLLFGYLGISADVSNYSTDLAQKLSKSGKTKYDIARLLTEMRNSYIHADNVQSKNNALEGDDALQYLSVLLHILELTILAVIGYQGYYRNRLKNPHPGEIERVPWAK
jgi:hypothetical protein